MQEQDLEFLDQLNQFDNENNLLNLQFLNLSNRRKREYRIRRRRNPMTQYNDRHFKNRFRFSKNEVKYIYRLIDGSNTLHPKASNCVEYSVILLKPFQIILISIFGLHQVGRSQFIPGIIKLMIALRFYAVGAFYSAIGDMFGVSRHVVNTSVFDVSFLIATKLRRRFVVMPETDEELLHAKMDFMRIGGFPLCIAAVDGTHALIQSYGGNDAEVYRNRKMVFSHNCQIVVSADVNE